MGDIELDELSEGFDDIEVVNVTGKSFRDRKRRSKRCNVDCNPSLRATTILFFIGIGVVYIIGVAIGVILIVDSLENLDTDCGNTSVNRLAMTIDSDIAKLQELTLSRWGILEYFTGKALRTYNQTLEKQDATQEDLARALQNLRHIFFIKVVNHEDFGFTCTAGVNYFSVLNLDFETLTDFFYPGNATHLCGDNNPAAPPIISPETYRAIVAKNPNTTGWLNLIIPDGGDSRPLILSIEEFGVYPLDPSDPNEVRDPNIYGYMVFGRSLFPRLGAGDIIADEVSSCITIEDGYEDARKWDAEDQKMFSQVTPGVITPEKSFGGVPKFVQRSYDIISATTGRVCPVDPLFNSTSNLMVGYMKLCGMDPEIYGEHSCVKIRVDRPMSMVEEGTMPVVSLSLIILALAILLCIIFAVFLDFVVLRRIENLSNVIRSQTRGHAKAQEEVDETSVAVSSVEEKPEKHGKSGRSSNGKALSTSGTSETSDTSASAAAAPQNQIKGPAHDEIGDLKRAMEQNAIGLRKRLEAVNDTIKNEQQKVVHHRQAMQLLNLWCGRKEFFPGLRPNAMQLRYEPTRKLDDILNNPLAIEYLKNHCFNERALENLWFLLDVSWLEELETAEDNEEDPAKRAQIHDVAKSAAKSIINRYIASNAPQQINLSAGTFKKLRDCGDSYSRKMFDDAVGEVRLLLDTDILPRFQKTNAYSALSETLYIDTSGGDDQSSEFSDETVSTAGSILTDDGSSSEGEANVGRIFAHTFKNLHTTFNVGQDENSSTGGDKIVKKKSDESPEKEPSKPSEDKEKDKKENLENSESSNHSLSSASLSESSSSSSSNASDASEK